MLTGAARSRAEARLRSIPDGERLIERQRRVARALGAGAELPPLHPAAAPAPPQGARRLVTAGALAAVLAVLIVLATQGGDPTPERAADIAQLPATDRAPAGSGRAAATPRSTGSPSPTGGPSSAGGRRGCGTTRSRGVAPPRSSTSTRVIGSGTRSSPDRRSRGPPVRGSSSATGCRCPSTATQPWRSRGRRVRARRADVRGRGARHAAVHPARARGVDGRRGRPILNGRRNNRGVRSLA